MIATDPTQSTKATELVAIPMAEFGNRYGLSYRHIAKLVRRGDLPCLDLGYHCKRIPIAEGDAAMLKLAGGAA
ncbi:MAG: hypothetical protein ACQKBV_10265 [Puniceicoccales bacterium]